MTQNCKTEANVAALPRAGSFIRVRADHPETARAGKDGQVIAVQDDLLAVYFGHDRFNRAQKVICVGPEAWKLDELDLASVAH